MYTLANVFYGITIDEAKLKRKFANSAKVDDYREEIEEFFKKKKVLKQDGIEGFYNDGTILYFFGIKGPEIECIQTFDLKEMKKSLELPKDYKLKYKEKFENLDSETKRILNMFAEKPNAFVIFHDS